MMRQLAHKYREQVTLILSLTELVLATVLGYAAAGRHWNRSGEPGPGLEPD
jgi:hypothetical protein